MLRLLLISILIVGYSTSSQGQLTATYETAFYFEDGAGNKDTIYLKQDPLVEGNSACLLCDELVMQEEYGEDYLTTPFDSIFEVRAGNTLDYIYAFDRLTEPEYYKFQKTVVMSTSTDAPFYPDCYYLGRDLVFMVRIKHLPLKVSFDAEFFREPCNAYNYFSNTSYFFQAAECEPEEILDCFQNPPENEFFACMDEGYFEYYFDKKYGEELLGTVDELALINDGSIDTLEFLQIEFGFQPLTPCFDIILDTEELEVTPIELKIYPNPASDEINFDFQISNEMSLQITSATGQLLFSEVINPTTHSLNINTAKYPTGIYFYSAFDIKTNEFTNGKFLITR